MRRRARIVVLTAWFAVALGVAMLAEEVPLERVAGIVDLVSTCRADAIKLESSLPRNVSWDGSSENLLYGVLSFGESSCGVIVDRSSSEPVLYVDVDGTGEFVACAWERTLSTGDRLSSVHFEVSWADGFAGEYSAFLIWSPFFPTALKVCRDEYRMGAVVLHGQSFRIAIVDDDSDGRYDDLDAGTLYIDVDQDGHWLTAGDSHELFRMDEAFDIAGHDYRVLNIAVDGSRITINETDEDATPKAPLLVGHPALPFEAVSLDGIGISLEALAGRIVLLDFWAGWCGPCVNELPTIRAIDLHFAEWGVTVIGINMDRSPISCDEAVSSHDLTYTMVYDGPDGPISTLYRIEGIPMTYVIDAEGVIRARDLRGTSLYDAIERLLAEMAEHRERDETEGDNR